MQWIIGGIAEDIWPKLLYFCRKDLTSQEDTSKSSDCERIMSFLFMYKLQGFIYVLVPSVVWKYSTALTSYFLLKK